MEHAGFIEATQFCTVHNIELSFIQSLHEYGLIEIRQDETQPGFLNRKYRHLKNTFACILIWK